MSLAVLNGLPETHSSGGLPPIPTRDQLCTAITHFQGTVATLPSFGTVNYTDGVVTSPQMTVADRQASYAAKKAAGDLIQTINVSWNYDEPGLPFNPPGCDLTKDLPLLKVYVREALEAGFYVELDLAGDGLSKDPQGHWVPDGYTGPFGYNDPVGWTYGWQWLMATFPSLYAAMGPTSADPADLRPYIRWRAGYDGCTPAWAGPENRWQRADEWFEFARSVIGNGVLVHELSAGFWAWSGEADDWNDRPAGFCVDLVQYEFPVPLGIPPFPPGPYDQPPWDPAYNQNLQIAKRLCGPVYQRPSGLPADYDPGYSRGTGPLAQPSPRGPRYVSAYEFDTYRFVRNQITVAQINAHRAFLAECGWPLIC